MVQGFLSLESEQLFFQLLRLGLGLERADGSDCIGFDSIHTIQTQHDVWCELFTMGARQGVAAIMMDGLQKLIDSGCLSQELLPSRELKMNWMAHTMKVEQQHDHHEVTVARLAGFYAKHDIRTMLLKGHGLSMLYPVPKHRYYGDIDIWLYGEQQRADELLNKEKGVKIERDHHHHTVFSVFGVRVENHFDFLNIYSHLSNKTLEKELKSLANHGCETMSVRGVDVHLPSADFNALFLLRHAASHFAADEIMIRHIVDWAMFALRYNRVIDWERLERTATEQNMHHFLHCMNGICIGYLGIPSDIFPPFDRNEEMERRVLNDIFSPLFSDKSALHGNLLHNFFFRLRRWWTNRWKHRMVYREGLLLTFLVQIRSHWMMRAEWS